MSTPSPPPRSPSVPQLVLAGCVVALAVSARAWWAALQGDPLPLLGAPGGEVWGHAWVQWWHAEAWPQWPAGPGEWVATARNWPVIDLLPTLLAATLGVLVDTVLAYDLVVLIGIVAAFVGGAVVARSEQGDPWVGGLGLALAPAWLGTVASGLTEDLAIGLAAVALGWVGHTDLRRAAGAGVCLGLLAASGLVLAWAAAVTSVGLGLWALFRSQQRRHVGTGLAVGTLTASVLTLPSAWAHVGRLGGRGHHLGRFEPRAEPLWQLNPWQGVDLASYFVPGSVDPGDALVRMHPGYPGLVLVILALWSGRSRWWAVLVGAMLVAPGPHLSIAGTPTGLTNPFVELLHALPFGSLINHHGRLLLLGSIALAILAARGVATLRTRYGRWVGGVAVALLTLDLALLSPVGVPMPVADPTPLAVYVDPAFADLPAGAVLQLPAAGPGVHFQRPLLDQRVHRRPLAVDPNHPGLSPAYGRTDTGRFLASLTAPDPAPQPTTPTWPPGVSVLVVAEPHVDTVSHVWGPPTVRTSDSAAWSAP